MKVLTIKAIERDFPNQWLLVQEASTSRDEVVRDIASNKDKELFFFFSGIAASPETAFALHDQRSSPSS